MLVKFQNAYLFYSRSLPKFLKRRCCAMLKGSRILYSYMSEGEILFRHAPHYGIIMHTS